MKIVTGYRGEPHITSQDHQSFYQGVFGRQMYVLGTGNEFEAQLTDTNTITVSDGDGIMQGCHFRIDLGEEVAAKLSNATSKKTKKSVVASIQTMCGGNSIILGCQPIRSSSSRYGSHQRLSVLILTPALLASSCFVIAFILNLAFNLNSYIIHLTSCILQHLLTCTYRKNSSARNFHVRTREEIVRFSVSVRHRVP